MSDPGKGKDKDSGGSLASGSFSQGDAEIDLPINIVLPSIDFSLGVPPISLGTPCGYALPSFPGLSIPIALDLGTIAGLLGLHIPIIEPPTVCPLIVEAALVAAVLALKKK